MLLVGLALAATSVGVASADAGPGPESGAWKRPIGPAASSSNYSYGYVSWNASSSTKAVALSAYGVAMPTGKCVTIYFDWGLSPITHYDARAARDCRNSQVASRTWSDSKSAIGGMQKLGVCYANLNTLQTGGGCVEHLGATASIASIPANFNATNCSVIRIYRNSSNTVTFYDGGSPTDAAC